MRANAAIIVILLVLSIALGMLLYRRHTQAEAQHKADEELILLHSNEWVQTRAKLDEQVKVNLSLETNLASRVAELLVTSNKLSDVSDTLVKTEAEVKATQEEVAKRDKRIADLEGQN